MKLVPRRMRDYSRESMSGRVSVHRFGLQDERFESKYGWALLSLFSLGTSFIKSQINFNLVSVVNFFSFISN